MPNLPDANTGAVSQNGGAMLDNWLNQGLARSEMGMRGMISNQNMQLAREQAQNQMQHARNMQGMENEQRTFELNKKLDAEKSMAANAQAFAAGENQKNRENMLAIEKQRSDAEAAKMRDMMATQAEMRAAELESMKLSGEEKAKKQKDAMDLFNKMAQLQADLVGIQQGRDATIGGLNSFKSGIDDTVKTLTEQSTQNSKIGSEAAKNAIAAAETKRLADQTAIMASEGNDWRLRFGAVKEGGFTGSWNAPDRSGESIPAGAEFLDFVAPSSDIAGQVLVGRVNQDSVRSRAQGLMMDSIATEIANRMGGKIPSASIQEALNAAMKDDKMTPAMFAQSLTAAGVPPQVIRVAVKNYAELASEQFMLARQNHAKIVAERGKDLGTWYDPGASNDGVPSVMSVVGYELDKLVSLGADDAYNKSAAARNAMAAADANQQYYQHARDSALSILAKLDDQDVAIKGLQVLQTKMDRILAGQQAYDVTASDLAMLPESERNRLDSIRASTLSKEMQADPSFLMNVGSRISGFKGLLPTMQEQINLLNKQADDIGTMPTQREIDFLRDYARRNARKVP